MENLKLKFDVLASHDITYVGIVQTARASGLERFPVPYVLTNCHNSLCAVGGTINEDDHVFGLSAAKKYGGEFVPAHQAVIHQYMRERYAACGKMILASDSHTRYGAFGALSIGEGGPELVKQLLCKTYDIAYPEVVGVELINSVRPGVGPQDVALAIIGATFKEGLVKNCVMEFIGQGISTLNMDFRSGIDVMTTETTCLSSVWRTDDTVKQYLGILGRSGGYAELAPKEGCYYDKFITVDLAKVEPMIALPFHPSNTYTIREFNQNTVDIVAQLDKDIAQKFKNPVPVMSKVKNGRLMVDQAIVAGCSGGIYQNICRMGEMLDGKILDNDAFWLSVYPASQPMMLELTKNGTIAKLLSAGATIRSAFCGPCFGAGDVPQNGGFSIRHTTRNFENREGSKPSDGQISYVALMDARSITATAINGGALTSAMDLENPPVDPKTEDYKYDETPYTSRVYRGVGKADPSQELVFGPNIADWPKMIAMQENVLINIASAIYDPVTTTDELIPSGETSSYRSNPLRLAEFTLSRKDPDYVAKAKQILAVERDRQQGVYADIFEGFDAKNTAYGSAIFSIKPGDGSAREQAASCQRVLGGIANICQQFATKRYRSNVINWGMLPLLLDNAADYEIKSGDMVYIKNIKTALLENQSKIAAQLMQDGKTRDITLEIAPMTKEERDTVLAGCLINYYSAN